MPVTKALLIKITAALAAFSTTAAGATIGINYYSKNKTAPKPKVPVISKIQDICPITEGESRVCDISEEHIEILKFSGSKGQKGLKISGLTKDKKIKLKTVKAKKEEKFDGDIKYILESNEDIEIGEGEQKITIKKGTNTEFKKKGEELVKAWQITKNFAQDTFATEKLKIMCDTSDDVTGKCNLSSDPIKLFKEGNVEDIITDNSDMVFQFTNDVEDYNQGIQFKVLMDIKNTEEVIKMAKDDLYEVKYVEDKKVWAFSKKN